MQFLAHLFEEHLLRHVWKLEREGQHAQAARLLERLAKMERPSGELRYASDCLKAAAEWAIVRDAECVVANARRALSILVESQDEHAEYYFGQLCEIISHLYAAGFDTQAETLANEINAGCEKSHRPLAFIRNDAAAPERCPQCGGLLPFRFVSTAIVCPHCQSVIRAEAKPTGQPDPIAPPPLEIGPAKHENTPNYLDDLAKGLSKKRREQMKKLLASESARLAERMKIRAFREAHDFPSAAKIHEEMAAESLHDNVLISMADCLDAAKDWISAKDIEQALSASRQAITRYVNSNFFPDPKYDEEMSGAAGAFYEAGYVTSAETIANEINTEYVKRNLSPRFAAPPGRFPINCPKCGGALPFTYSPDQVQCSFCGEVVAAQ